MTSTLPHQPPPHARQPRGGPTPAAHLPSWLARATQAAFEAGAALRRQRAFHPRGVTFSADVRIAARPPVELPAAFRPGATYPALVRLSKGAGLPGGLPDALGFALRFVDLYGRGGHQDILVTAASSLPLLRSLLTPAVAFDATGYSSLVPFAVCGRRLLFGVRAERPGRRVTMPALRGGSAGRGLRFELLVGARLGRWRPFAEVTLGDRLPDEESAALDFDPWHTGPDIRPVGILNALRAPAYEGSRRARAGREQGG